MRPSVSTFGPPPPLSIPPRGVLLLRRGSHVLFGTPTQVVAEMHGRSLLDADTDLPGYLDRVSVRLALHGHPALPPGGLDDRARAALQALAALGLAEVELPVGQA
jgi:hypothetical protein